MRDPKDIIEEISGGMLVMDDITAEMKPFQDRIARLRTRDNELRTELYESMAANGDKTKIHGRIQASAKVRRDTKIVDQGQVKGALAEAGRLDECLITSLDTAAVKRVAKDLGELLPGMEATETAFVEIKAVA